jgi:uncharacterized protein YbjT (DUF2867 family)
MAKTPTILLTGATGYIGGRLLPELIAAGHGVRCMARRPECVRVAPASPVEVVAGDVFDPASLARAMKGIDTAFYLVHCMGSPRGFEASDRRAAETFADAVRAAGVRRVVYLGGLGDSGDGLSAHLRSRHEVGQILRRSGAEVLEFRASIVIGAGSVSFEMIRALVERLPVMITPRWVSNLAQPIAIEDLVAYLVESVGLPFAESRIVEVGGPDCVSYAQLMREYARQRGLRRWMLRVPVLTPRLSSLWLGLVTPLYARVGRALIEGIRNPTVVKDPSAQQLFSVRPRRVDEAIARALHCEDHEMAATRWSDAMSWAVAPRTWAGVRFGNRLVDSRTLIVDVPPHAAFAPIRRIGGVTGWYYANWLWQTRGWIDLVVGGVGLRRGRRDDEQLRAGDVVDCWRVESIEPDRRLRLSAEMMLPGRAWLEFEVEPHGEGSKIRQTAIFDPVGLAGLAYWYLVYPLHRLVFGGMLRGVAAAARRNTHA